MEAVTTERTGDYGELTRAMDAIDAMRADDELLLQEVGRTDRRAALGEKLRAIYEASGVHLTDATIEAAVSGLDRRFTYEPPRRSLAVLAARLYVTRARWWKRAATVSAAVVAVAAAGSLATHVVHVEQEHARVAARDAALAGLKAVREDLAHARALDLQLKGMTVPTVVVPALATLRAKAADLVSAAAAEPGKIASTGIGPRASPAEVEAAQRELDAYTLPGHSVEAILSDARRWVGIAPSLELVIHGATANPYQEQGRKLRGAVQADIAAADLQAADLAVKAVHDFDSAVRASAGMVMPADADQEAKSVLIASMGDVRHALDGGETAAANAKLARYNQLVHVIETPMVVKIVDRPGERSGVWRYPNGNVSARNYYLVVEATDQSGQAQPILVTNEETQKSEMTSMFAVRVPEKEYEAVKDEKVSTGHIAKLEVGDKPAGALQVKFNVATAGGTITEW